MPEGSRLDDLAGAPFALAGLLDYQDGAVVSRTLVDGASGVVTLFAFDAGERLTEHTAPHDALLHVLDGTAGVTVGGASHEVGTGEAIVLPADVPHAVDAPEPFVMLLTLLR